MKELCHIDLPSFKEFKSPFGSMLILDYWDGPVSGLLWCESGSKVYRFQVVAWDKEQWVRIAVLYAAKLVSREQLSEMLSPIGPPRSPAWIPSVEPANEDHARAIERLNPILEAARTPTCVIAASSNFLKTILGANSLDSEALQRLPQSIKFFPRSDGGEDWEFWKSYLHF